MDALQLLREDHLRVKDLFRRYDEEQDTSTRRAVVDEAVAELTIHSQIEEQVFYPAMKRAGMTELVDHSGEEHAAADRIMQEIAKAGPRDANVEAKFRMLIDVISEHVDEEESEMFPRAAELGYDRLERIGAEMARLRDRLMGGGTRRTSATRSRSTRSPAGGTARNRNGAARTRKTGTRSPSTSASRSAQTSNSRTGRSSTSRTTARGSSRSRRQPVAGRSAGSSRAGQSSRGANGETRQELYERARRMGIEGRSSMTKQQLARAVSRK